MAEKYCYACHCNDGKDVKMDFNPGASMYGTYVCPECGHTVDKKTSSDSSDKYI